MKPPTPKLSKKEQQILLDTVWSLHCLPAREKQESILSNAISNVKAFKIYPAPVIEKKYQSITEAITEGLNNIKSVRVNSDVVNAKLDEIEGKKWKRAIKPTDGQEGFKTNWWYECGMDDVKYYHNALFKIDDRAFIHASSLNKSTLIYTSKVICPPGNVHPGTERLIGGIEHNIGLHQKGDNPGESSYYKRQIKDNVWREHERGTDMLGPDLVGWDYCNMHLSDGSKLCFYNLRYADGDYSTTNMAWYYDGDGNPTTLAYNEYKTTIMDWWTSPKSGAKYPIKQSITVAKLGLNLTITPIIDDQEFNVKSHTIYYEGSVKIAGVHINLKTHELNAISGWGFLELTGYVSPLKV